MVVLLLTIPLMALGLAVALGPLLLAIARERHAGATPCAPTILTAAGSAPRGRPVPDSANPAASSDEQVLVSA